LAARATTSEFRPAQSKPLNARDPEKADKLQDNQIANAADCLDVDAPTQRHSRKRDPLGCRKALWVLMATPSDQGPKERQALDPQRIDLICWQHQQRQCGALEWSAQQQVTKCSAVISLVTLQRLDSCREQSIGWRVAF
jgi:hypothetical protein